MDLSNACCSSRSSLCVLLSSSSFFFFWSLCIFVPPPLKRLMANAMARALTNDFINSPFQSQHINQTFTHYLKLVPVEHVASNGKRTEVCAQRIGIDLGIGIGIGIGNGFAQSLPKAVDTAAVFVLVAWPLTWFVSSDSDLGSQTDSHSVFALAMRFCVCCCCAPLVCVVYDNTTAILLLALRQRAHRRRGRRECGVGHGSVGSWPSRYYDVPTILCVAHAFAGSPWRRLFGHQRLPRVHRGGGQDHDGQTGLKGGSGDSWFGRRGEDHLESVLE